MSKLLGKKGQAALEFLTTYGWAFMVILVMIGALAYFGVLNPEKLIPDQCSITSGFTCGDYQITANSVNFSMINNVNSDITVSNLNITKAGALGCTAGTLTISPAGGNVADGQKFYLSCQTTTTLLGKSQGKVKLGYAFDYKKSDGDFLHAASGTLSATMK